MSTGLIGGRGGSKNKGSEANYYTNYNTEKGEGTDNDMSNYVWKETLRMVKLRKVCVCGGVGVKYIAMPVCEKRD